MFKKIRNAKNKAAPAATDMPEPQLDAEKAPVYTLIHTFDGSVVDILRNRHQIYRDALANGNARAAKDALGLISGYVDEELARRGLPANAIVDLDGSVHVLLAQE